MYLLHTVTTRVAVVDEAGEQPRHHLIHDELQVAHHYQQTLILKPKLFYNNRCETKCVYYSTLNLHC